ncbi:MAG TPA: GTP cyclohydrolase FolE2 [Spirochaetales bacterium]|nr:GTP cyclohydrolase FolE2 [Spirochaetales bacterium]HPS14275.1 GTP cyclohydrolase FolE2 [Spirochaetales bacterium]
MVDVQSMKDERQIPLQKVGVKGVRYPIVLKDKSSQVQHTTAVVNLYADLPHDFKGTHMSRFIEVFEQYRSDLSMPRFLKMLESIRTQLEAETAYSDLHFPYFIQKAAPVTGQVAMMSYDCFYEGMVSSTERKFVVGVSVPVQTLCPCSKAISRYGAHNQRGIVTLKVTMDSFYWIEDLIALVEDSASSGVYTLLKREDEKFVTEMAYDRPRFVEDVVREVYLKVDALHKFSQFTVEAENFESIHNHSAYAFVEKNDIENIVEKNKESSDV